MAVAWQAMPALFDQRRPHAPPDEPIGPNDPIRCIALDFGGVVVEWDLRNLFRTVFADETEMEHFLEHVLTPEENLRLDLGMPLADLVDDLARRHPTCRAALEAWRDRWTETIPGAGEGTAELIDELIAAELRVVGLSNFSAETFAWIRHDHDVFDRLHDIVLSSEVGLAKPDPAIFRLLCARNGLGPGQIVFFDDNVVNIESATAVGLHGRLFTDAAAAREDLAALGVLPGSQCLK